MGVFFYNWFLFDLLLYDFGALHNNGVLCFFEDFNMGVISVRKLKLIHLMTRGQPS